MPVAPGNERTVHAGESAAGDVDAVARRVDAELDRCERRAVANALRGQLVDGGGAGIEVIRGGALHVAAGKPDGYFGPVAVASDGILIPEIFEQDEIVLELFERLEVGRDLEVFAIAGRGPIFRAHAV